MDAYGARQEGLFAVPFDADRREVKGGAVPLEQGIMRAWGQGVNTASANYGVSEEGTLVYIRSMPDTRQGTLTWVTRDGRETPLTALALDQPRNPRLSPDGKRLAVVVAENLWVYDVAGRPPIKLTSDGADYSPLWAPDGQRLVIDRGSASFNLFILPADGSGTLQAVSPAGHFHPHGWSADGELVAARRSTSGTTTTSCGGHWRSLTPSSPSRRHRLWKGFVVRCSRPTVGGWPMPPTRPDSRRSGCGPIRAPARP